MSLFQRPFIEYHVLGIADSILERTQLPIQERVDLWLLGPLVSEVRHRLELELDS